MKASMTGCVQQGRIFTIISNPNQPAMLSAVDDMISSDFATAEDNTKQYGYSGFAYVPLEQLNQINANTVVHQIYWNADDVKSYLK